jgi:hypothetical protein
MQKCVKRGFTGSKYEVHSVLRRDVTQVADSDQNFGENRSIHLHFQGREVVLL